MSDFLDVLAADAKATVNESYYDNLPKTVPVKASMRKAILQAKTAAVITEIKGASPSKGTIRQSFKPNEVAQSMMRGGAVGISVLTEPKHFSGSLGNIRRVREAIGLPVLMKDIVVSPVQLEAASKVGANVVLLIQAVFDRGYCSFELSEMVAKAHSNNLEVLLETHNQHEFLRAVETNADLVGINNRNLGTLKVDLDVTKNVLANCNRNSKVVVSESGVNTAEDLRCLRECGAQAFLVGSSVMLAPDVEAKVKELVNA
ncbi:MAG: indole-3-glycerol-phosphate synthase [Candidatus Bathyarchaeota archaeon]|nr:indole-3-glycerol-phosphate synthase [Candidatus Bathyarchaeota archaeon]